MVPDTSHKLAFDLREELERIIPNLLRFARSRTQSLDDAEDLVQESVVRILRREEPYLSTTHLLASSMTTVKNLHLDLVKSRQVRGENLDLTEIGDQSDPNSEQIFRCKIELNEALKVIDTLPEPVKSILIYRGQGLSYSEIAEKVNLDVPTVTKRLHRGRKQLETILGDGD